ncbi:TonB-dependent receptor domain-containing protein [Stieleria neptunia]|uniref:TonB-dependent receptor domain-containing protein n=1 Tax=Stieleria neptunia TaxID=2527979 RepID=UPI00119D77E9|nr:TonB-dependent receptor [Stieleria neptunia]
MGEAPSADAIRFAIPNDDLDREADRFRRETSPLRQTTMLQPTPFGTPVVSVQEPVAQTDPATSLTTQLFGRSSLDRSVLRQARLGVASFSTDIVRGREASSVVSTDLGSLLRKSPGGLSVKTQRRTPIVNDTRVRSSRVGALAASGSHWVPAREDLDTALSKIDSRLVNDVIIIPGPYSSVYGPGFHFVDFELLQSPRFAGGNELHGQTSFDHQSNGNQWLAQQSLWAGGEDWGMRGNYSHRYGSDYEDGDGSSVPSSYESREFTVALGRDLGDDRSIEFSLLRLDQTDVEFPGYVFDIDYLVTDGYEVAYIDANPEIGDRVETEVWYNRTRFEGNAQNIAKRPQFPFLNRIRYIGFTDVDSMSTGYRRGRTWGEAGDDVSWTVGHDLRFVKQELNEISDAVTLGFPFPVTDRNSPIPKSFAANPGLFAEYNERLLDCYTFKAGARVDYVQTDITADPAGLREVGLDAFPASYEEIVGTSISQTDRVMWSLYGSLTREHNEALTTSASLGFGQRAPTLTELYAAQPFLLLLQNGLNNVTGDPTLKQEKMLQADLSLDFDGDYLRCGTRGFYGWAFDYITFENTQVTAGPPSGDVQQVSLRYVNTSLATLAGFESFLELLPQERLSPFVTMRYVDGRDRTRNGDFATTNGAQGSASTKVPGLARGFFSGITGGDSEPLPGISPLETRIGFRLRDATADPNWNVELAARIVDDQDRVATSLLENATPGFTVYDVRGTYRPRFNDNLLLAFGIENFTDKTFREHLDFRSLTGVSVYQPGINFYVGADLTY